MTQWVPAALAFAAFGANLLTGGLLLLFNPHSRGVRWYVLFVAAICAWLLGQGVFYADATPHHAWSLLRSGAVLAMPALFFAAALAECSPRYARFRFLVILLCIGALPLLLPALTGSGTTRVTSAAIWIWQIAGWGGGSFVHYRADWRADRRGIAGSRSLRTMVGIFLLLAPLTVIAAQVVGSDDFFSWVMPPLTIVIQFMIFVGVTRLRFYDIEVRASRSGGIATQAAETERLAVLGELAATVAHEVRNPLTGMRSLAQRIADDEVDADRRRQYATVILEEIARVERMVSNLLDVARRSPVRGLPASKVELDSLFGDLALLTAVQAKQAGVTVQARANAVGVNVARHALAQALLNLLINAIAHSPAGSAVVLSARRADGAVEIAVSDAGPGVPLADRERIFEPFHTTRADGSGLGLAVVRRLASELDWKIDVRAAQGGGAEFVLRIPDTGAVK